MYRSACCWLTGLVCIGLLSMPGWAQPSSAPAKSPAHPGETSKSPPEEKPAKRPTLDKMKIPAGGVLVLVEEIKEALSLVPTLVPKMVLLTPEKFQEMQDRIQVLEKQLKSEQEIPHSCKLTGRVQGDFAFLQADFSFATRGPRSNVLLGLQGAQLLDEGEMDHQVPLLEYNEGSLLVRVDHAGPHQLRLKLKVPVSYRRAVLPGTSAERGIELGLPGAAVTRLSLALPAGVKEIRWNDYVEKDRVQGRWEIALGTARQLNLSWKEPQAMPGIGPLQTVDGQITVKVEESQVLITAELQLQDLRGQTREWPLLLPAGTRVDLKNPTGIPHEWIASRSKPVTQLLRLNEPSGERLIVQAQVRRPRPQPGTKLAIGPFLALGALRQQGTITVQGETEALRGQRLVFHPKGDVFPRDPGKNLGPGTPLAVFQYWNLPPADQPASPPSKKISPAQVPLELEFKTDKGPITTQVEHVVRLHNVGESWQIDTTTKIKSKSLHDLVDSLEVFLPRQRPPPLGLPGVAVPLGFPGALPWGALGSGLHSKGTLAFPYQFNCADESNAELVPAEGNKPARLKWYRPVAKEFSVTLQGKYWLPAGCERAHLQLPRPLGVIDRGGKVTLQVDDKWELLVPTPTGDEPAVEKHQQVMHWDQAPAGIDIAWKAFRPDWPVTSVTDLTLFQNHGHVQHQLTLHIPPRLGRPAVSSRPIRLPVPAGIKTVAVSGGGKLLTFDADKATLWLNPTTDGALGKVPVVLDYDFPLPPPSSPSQGGTRPAEGETPVPQPPQPSPEGAKSEPQSGVPRTFAVPLLWPEQTTRLDSKVRVWCDPGMILTQAGANLADNMWKNLGTEVVQGQDSLPALVLHAAGHDLQLSLSLLEGSQPYLPGGVFDRGLIQVAVEEDGTHHCRARFLVRKLNTRFLDVELPVPVMNAVLSITLGQKRINHWHPLETNVNVARIPVEPGLFSGPVLLDLEYKVPASLAEGGRFWQTTLYPPLFRQDLFLGRLRWQVSLPSSWIAFPAKGRTWVDYHWHWQGWLLAPQPAPSNEEVEQWLLVKEAPDSPWPVSLAFWRTSLAPLRLWHLSRQAWFLLCSGLFLVVSLSLTLLPLSRLVFWGVLVGIGLGLWGVALFWPALLPLVLYGCQPGVMVLILILALQWLLQERYRRRVVFMPGFSRLKPGSSLIRPAAPRAGEPSTVDAPPPAGSAPPSTGSATGS